MAYATLADLRSWLSIDDSWDDGTLSATLSAAESAVEAHCGQLFTSVTATRLFVPDDELLLFLNQSPIATAAGMSISMDVDNNGSYETSVPSTDWLLEPINGLGPTGETGWPYTRIRLINGRTWTASDWGRPTVQITAQWGWPTVPEAVRQATLIGAAWLWSQKASPTGVQMTEFGPMTIRSMPQAERLLAPYRRGGAIIAIGGVQ